MLTKLLSTEQDALLREERKVLARLKGALGATPGREVKESNLHVITAPSPILRDIHIVDTPGTNAIVREHEASTQEFVPRSDLVLFVTSADRPFTETERAFLGQEGGDRHQQDSFTTTARA